MKEEERPIIKKVVKKHHEGHHGGAWKVAYADFVTAMMALFLVLWLVAMLSIEARKGVAEYFRSYTIFKGEEAGGGKGISIMKGGPIKLSPEEGGIRSRGALYEKLTEELSKAVEIGLSDLKDQIIIVKTPEGVRVEVVEKSGSPIFELGKSELLPRGKRVFHVLASKLSEVDVKIVIEGHTDSHPYPGVDYTNWELAADRANAVRRELIRDGIDPESIVEVRSFADRKPIKPDDPYDPINRRVSLLIRAK